MGGRDVNQLTVDGLRMTEARFPNEVPSDPNKGGWLWAKAPPPGTDLTRQIAYDPDDFPAGTLAPE